MNKENEIDAICCLNCEELNLKIYLLKSNEKLKAYHTIEAEQELIRYLEINGELPECG